MNRKPVLEYEFNYRGYPCVVLFQPLGIRCGYVGLKDGEYGFGMKNYDEIEVECHGGLTYSAPELCADLKEEHKRDWWIGFDCGHFGDGYDIDKLKEYWPDREITQYMLYMYNAEYPYRSVDYVAHECRKIVRRLIKKENELLAKQVLITSFEENGLFEKVSQKPSQMTSQVSQKHDFEGSENL